MDFTEENRYGRMYVSTGVIPRPHRKPTSNNACVVFRCFLRHRALKIGAHPSYGGVHNKQTNELGQGDVWPPSCLVVNDDAVCNGARVTISKDEDKFNFNNDTEKKQRDPQKNKSRRHSAADKQAVVAVGRAHSAENRRPLGQKGSRVETAYWQAQSRTSNHKVTVVFRQQIILHGYWATGYRATCSGFDFRTEHLFTPVNELTDHIMIVTHGHQKHHRHYTYVTGLLGLIDGHISKHPKKQTFTCII
uniref:SFRICE_021670 n=1 Tax=Spodoptera frugiperda TaxID=7108 RepID=A0A2H1VWL5_SPOFR